MTVDRGAAGELGFLAVGFWWLPSPPDAPAVPAEGALEGRRTGNAPNIERLPLASTPPRPHYCARKQLAGKRLQNCEVCPIYMTTIYGRHSFWPPTLGYVNNLLIGWLNMVLSNCGDFSHNLEVDSLAVALEEQTAVFSQ